MKCKVINCGRSDKSHPGLHFYRFPKDPIIRREWIKVCVGSADKEDILFFKLSASSRMCSIHFPNGKRNANGTWNIPIGVAPLDEEWLEVDEIENIGCDDQVAMQIPSGFDLLDDEMDENINTVEIVGCNGQMPMRGDDKSPCFSGFDSTQSRLRCEIFRLKEQVTKLKRLVCRWRSRYGNLVARKQKENSNSFQDCNRKLFNADQLALLSGKVRQVKQWSEATVMDSLQIRFACQGGYDKLIKRGYPLPSTRTLLRRIADVHFPPGILEDILELLKYKVAGMTDVERDCGLVLDEMSLDEAVEWCASVNQFVGKTTLPPTDALASKGLVVMLVGVAERWKQVVAYEFTKASIPPEHLKRLVLHVIQRAEEIGLRVHFITSDSGSENQKMWKDMGLTIKNQNILSDLSLVHPLDNNRKLEIIPDPVHVFKNAVNGWINNEFLVVPKWYVEEKGLSSDVVHRDHLKTLVDFEKGNELRMAHGLSPTDVAFDLHVSSVDKMKVSNATKYCNRAVAAALRVVASDQDRPELITTACYIEDMSDWFETINNRTDAHALREGNKEALDDAIQRLQKTSRLIYDVRVGGAGRWKPWKTGLVICTNAIIRLVLRFFASGHKRIFTSRFVQDCLESLFSVIRSKQRRPTPRDFGRNLKTVTLSQYMAPVPNSSYSFDDQEHLVGMADFLSQRRKESKKRRSIAPTSSLDSSDAIDVDYEMLQEASEEVLDRGEKNALFYITGYIVRSLSNKSTVCKQCLQMTRSQNNVHSDYHCFTSYRANATKRNFCFPSIDTFNFFKAMEVTYRNSKNHLEASKDKQTNIEQKLVKELELLPNVFHCSSFKMTLIRRYVSFRLKSGQKRKQRKKKFDSRSMLA